MIINSILQARNGRAERPSLLAQYRGDIDMKNMGKSSEKKKKVVLNTKIIFFCCTLCISKFHTCFKII